MSQNLSVRQRVAGFLRRSVMEIVLAVLCLVLSLRVEGFCSTDNLLNILRNVSMQGVIAFGMTMVIIAGEIDLSVGSMVAFSGCLAAWLVRLFLGSPALAPALAVGVAVPAAIGAGLVVGAISGLLRTRFRVPTFITTLAWMTVLRGGAELITNGFPLTPFPEWYAFLGAGTVLRVPFPVIVFATVFVAVHAVMGYTPFGRAVYAVGGNAEAARLSGLRVERVKIVVMAIVAGLAALAGIMQSAQIMAGSAATAQGWELDVIASVIIGGTSLMGGAGSVRGTLVGIVFLGVLVNGMTMLNISEYWQHVVRGGLILIAVLINTAPGAGD